jgi:hypothetical protein
MTQLISIFRKNLHADCLCQHAEGTHEHYRRGSDCGVPACPCQHYSAQPAPARTPVLRPSAA